MKNKALDLSFEPVDNERLANLCGALDENLRQIATAGRSHFSVSERGRILLVPVPEVLMNITLGRFGLPRLPTGAVDHLKFPIVIDSADFKKATGFQHAYEEAEALSAYRKSD